MKILNRANLSAHENRVQTVAKAMLETAMDDDPTLRSQIEQMLSVEMSTKNKGWMLIDIFEQGLLAKAEEALRPATRAG